MTEKESYIIVGKLACYQYKSVYCETYRDKYGTIGYDTFVMPHELAEKIQLYLQTSQFTYEFVDKILSGKVAICVQDYNGKMKSTNVGEYWVNIQYSKGRFGIRSVYGTATHWLDEYKQTWWLKEDIENN